MISHYLLSGTYLKRRRKIYFYIHDKNGPTRVQDQHPKNDIIIEAHQSIGTIFTYIVCTSKKFAVKSVVYVQFLNIRGLQFLSNTEFLFTLLGHANLEPLLAMCTILLK